MVLGSSEMGGVQAFILNLLRNIDLGRFQVDIAINEEVKESGVADEWRALGCQIFLLPKFKVYNYFPFVRQWKDFLRKHRYDIVHAHSTDSASVYLKVVKEMGCATIAHCHSTGHLGNVMEKTVKCYFAHKVGRVADYWFACSDAAAESVFGSRYQKYEHYYNIPNAINAENYLFNIDKAIAIRRQLGVQDEELLCGHVGSFSTPKNHSFLLEIFVEVLKLRPDARLVCCGTGPLMPQAKAKARELGILDKVLFTGVVNNVNDYMMAMDVFVFPSLFEGFPIAVIEAEATGLPVVMSDVITKEVDMTDLVHRHALTDCASTWATAIRNIISGNRQIYNRIIADSKYNMRTSVQLISSLYEEMVKRNADATKR